MNFTAICKTCKKLKSAFVCGLCTEPVCKSCGQFTNDAFAFRRSVPKELSHSVYCGQCFDETVAAPLADYEATLERSRDVIVFLKNETKRTGHLKRKEIPLTVTDCEDEEETVLRLAFFAAEAGHNCLLDVAISHRKIIVGSHKKTIFSGTAIPTKIDPSEVREY